MSVHTLHVEQSPGSRAGHWPESMVLNGSSMDRAFTNVVYPGTVAAAASQSKAYGQHPSDRWVCRQVAMSPPGPGPGPGLGYQPHPPGNSHQTLSVKSAYGQKPPSPCPHTVLRRAASDYRRTPREPERTEAWNIIRPGSAGEQNPGDQASSPTLDATIENLNNLILELDPTFQPINSGVRVTGNSLRHVTGSGSLTASPQCHAHKEEFPGDTHGTGILLYSEWDSPGRRGEQNSVSLTKYGEDLVDSPGLGDIGSPNSNSHHKTFALPGYVQARNGWSGLTSLSRDISQPVAVSKPHIPTAAPSSSLETRYIEMSPRPNGSTARGTSTRNFSQRSRGLCISPSESLSTSPQQNTLPILVPSPHGSLRREATACNYLSMSPVSENATNCSLARPTRLAGSTGSLLSTSPGSDILGSSQSLLSEDGRMYRSAYGSSGSFVNVTSPFGTSPGSCKISFSDQRLHEASLRARGAGRSASQHAATYAGKRMGSHQHGAAQPQYISSCPASAATSLTDIPLLLINGAPEHGQGQGHWHRKPPPSPGYATEANAYGTARRPLTPRLSAGSAGSLKASSLVSLDDQCDSQPTIKFVQDTSKYWYKPNLTREQAIEILKDKEPGSFFIRESSTYVGSYGLAMKVSSSVSSPGSPPGNSADSPSQQIRHFLIEFSRKGVSLKGSAQEPFFGSLSALVYQHCITPMALPCKLILPRKDCSSGESSPESPEKTVSPLMKNGAVFNVLYLNSVTMETLTGPQAILKATSLSLEREPMPPATVVQLRVNEQGITLTDSKRRLFFRRHYTASTVNHCGLDPLQRKWRKDNEPSRMFGFVAKSQLNAAENMCHLFAEYQHDQAASLIINSISSILPGLQRA